MTAYEKLTTKIETIEQCALRCMNNDKRLMAFIWTGHAYTLRQKRDEMTIKDAFCIEAKE